MEEYLNDNLSDNDRKFHKSRIAFMIINDEILFLEDSDMSHKEWATKLGVEIETFKQIVRGYYKDNQIIFYKGNFIYDDQTKMIAYNYIDKIKEYCGLESVDVYLGIKVGEPGEIWPGDYYLGNF